MQLDYYGKRLATCSSDRTVKVYDVMEGGERKQVADLKGCASLACAARAMSMRTQSEYAQTGPARRAPQARAGRSLLTAPRLRDRRHDGPVWQVAWAHPKFGTLLATCSSPERRRDG